MSKAAGQDRREKVRFLNAYRWALLQEQELLHQIEETRSRSAQLTQALSGMPGAAGEGSSLERAVESLIEIQQRLCRQVETSCKARCQVEQAISTLADPRRRTILWLHYISGKTFEQIAVQMHYSYRQILREYSRAMDVIECHMESE